ncbi:hypothetical protein [Anaerocaecibacter muris]|jgi:hypothetical protein|uniref:hypothetical protein n=1 Tax=Anaerocaecibacter muris TaxID=2941513 RepID=UPI002041B035|nr:hypothetical protein [Anaerocaecibacter muris]
MDRIALKDISEPRKLLGTMNALIDMANESGASVFDVADLQMSLRTLTGTGAVAMFKSLSVSGITLTSGTLDGAERCLQC